MTKPIMSLSDMHIYTDTELAPMYPGSTVALDAYFYSTYDRSESELLGTRWEWLNELLWLLIHDMSDALVVEKFYEYYPLHDGYPFTTDEYDFEEVEFPKPPDLWDDAVEDDQELDRNKVAKYILKYREDILRLVYEITEDNPDENSRHE